MSNDPAYHFCNKKRKIKPSTLFATGVLGGAILLSAWKGTVDYMALGLFAVVMKLPGSKWLIGLFKSKSDDVDSK